jgi:cytochrome oxidase Cu insertion factor (SCO1/SenC/PrrC family)
MKMLKLNGEGMMKRIRMIFLSLLLFLLAACGTSTAEEPAGVVGMDAPDFTLDDALGGQTSLSDFSGEPVLLFFHMAVG